MLIDNAIQKRLTDIKISTRDPQADINYIEAQINAVDTVNLNANKVLPKVIAKLKTKHMLVHTIDIDWNANGRYVATLQASAGKKFKWLDMELSETSERYTRANAYNKDLETVIGTLSVRVTPISLTKIGNDQEMVPIQIMVFG